MSVAAITAVWQRSRAKGSDLLVLLAIADYAKDNGKGAFPSVPTLARKSRLSQSAVHGIITRLIASGELVRHMSEGPNGVNLYDIVLPETPVQTSIEIPTRGPESAGGGTGSGPGPDSVLVHRAVPDPSVQHHHRNGVSEVDLLGSRTDVPVSSTSKRPSPNDLRAAWNAHRGRMIECKELSEERLRRARARLRTYDDIDEWTRLIRALASNPYFTGDNERAWVASFDYLLNTDTMTKFREGRYARRQAPRARTAEQQRQQTRNANVSHVAKGGIYVPQGGEE